MTRSTSWRLVAASGALALGAGVLSVATPAGAATGAKDYKCTVDGKEYTVSVDTDTDAPAKMYVGDTAAPKVTSTMTLPNDLRADLYDAPREGRSVEGTGTFKASVAGQAQDVALTIAETTIDPAKALVLLGSGVAAEVKPTVPGDVVITAGDLAPKLVLTQDGGATLPVEATCAPLVADAVIDTVVVAAKSTTELTLEPVTTTFGQVVKAQAKVAVTAGKAEGKVDFAIGSKIVSADVDATGVAKVDLPFEDAATAAYPVTATFKPKDAVHYDTSTSAPVNVTVARDTTKANLEVRYQSGRKRFVTVTKVTSANGRAPAGMIKVVLKHKGKVVAKVLKKANAKGNVTVPFGHIKKGVTYKIKAKFKKSTNFERSKDKVVFRVPR